MSLQSLTNTAAGLNNTVTGIQATSGRLGTGTFFSQLRPASFRGVRFGVFGGHARFGRRNAIHEYPFRDEVWVEDLGRAVRRVSLTAFLVGDDVIAQRQRLIQACEMPGPGELIHPTLGRLTVSLIDGATEEQWDKGRVFSFALQFVETGKRIFPTIQASTGSAVAAAADTSDLSAVIDFALKAVVLYKLGESIVKAAVSTAKAWTAEALQIKKDATSFVRMIRSLPGQFGRFVSDVKGTLSGHKRHSSASATATVSSAVGQMSMHQAAVSTASAGLVTAAGGTNPQAHGAAAQAVTAAVLAAASDPLHAINILAQIATFTPVTTPNASVIGQGVASMQTASGDLFRRAAVVSMARASAAYQPTSSDDAVTVRNSVVALLDSEILVAADQSEDATFTALRALRAAVIQDLNSRGAGLPAITTFTVGRPLPASVLAQRFYRDPNRTDELIMLANPKHPAFMPTSFKALSR